jgi:hypothetical protein
VAAEVEAHTSVLVVAAEASESRLSFRLHHQVRLQWVSAPAVLAQLLLMAGRWALAERLQVATQVLVQLRPQVAVTAQVGHGRMLEPVDLAVGDLSPQGALETPLQLTLLRDRMVVRVRWVVTPFMQLVAVAVLAVREMTSLTVRNLAVVVSEHPQISLGQPCSTVAVVAVAFTVQPHMPQELQDLVASVVGVPEMAITPRLARRRPHLVRVLLQMDSMALAVVEADRVALGQSTMQQ